MTADAKTQNTAAAQLATPRTTAGKFSGYTTRERPYWPLFMFGSRTNVVSVPLWFGQPRAGVDNGPERMKAHGTLSYMTDKHSGFNLDFSRNLHFDQVANDTPFANIKRPRSVGKANKKIADSVADALKDGEFCLALGGDHSLAIGSILGQYRAQNNFGVIWVDAHADLNPPQASGSGNAHGMPLSFLIRDLAHLIPSNIPEFDWVEPCLDIHDVAYIGLRDLDPAEKQIIKEYGMSAYTMHDVQEHGIGEIVRRAIADVSYNNTRPIHLSFDIDGLDPTVAPSTGTPVPGGLQLAQGVYIVEKVAETGLLTMMDLVEVNPDLGSPEDQKKTMDAASEIIGAWYGRRSKFQIPPGYSVPFPQ